MKYAWGVVVCAAAVAAACGEKPAPAGQNGAAQGGAMQMEPRIALQPTAADSLPPAVLGLAAPPQGKAVHYFPQDSLTQGYLALPEGAGPFPAVILIHEWNGLVDRVRQVADALAAEGYVALAADLYSGKTGGNPQENVALMNAVWADSTRMIENLNAAVQFLRARSDVTGKIGAMGWCFGGGIALSFGLDGVNHEATAMFYGRLVDDPARLKRITHEVYGTFAGKDQSFRLTRCGNSWPRCGPRAFPTTCTSTTTCSTASGCGWTRIRRDARRRWTRGSGSRPTSSGRSVRRVCGR